MQQTAKKHQFIVKKYRIDNLLNCRKKEKVTTHLLHYLPDHLYITYSIETVSDSSTVKSEVMSIYPNPGLHLTVFMY